MDTRALVSYIRDHGAMNAVISTEVDKIDELSNYLTEPVDSTIFIVCDKIKNVENK